MGVKHTLDFLDLIQGQDGNDFIDFFNIGMEMILFWIDQIK